MQRATRTFKEIESTSKNSGPYSVQRRIFLADGLGDGSRPARRPLRKYFWKKGKNIRCGSLANFFPAKLPEYTVKLCKHGMKQTWNVQFCIQTSGGSPLQESSERPFIPSATRCLPSAYCCPCPMSRTRKQGQLCWGQSSFFFFWNRRAGLFCLAGMWLEWRNRPASAVSSLLCHLVLVGWVPETRSPAEAVETGTHAAALAGRRARTYHDHDTAQGKARERAVLTAACAGVASADAQVQGCSRAPVQ